MGQAQCWDTDGVEIICAGSGQDGELQAGVLYRRRLITPLNDVRLHREGFSRNPAHAPAPLQSN